MKKSKLTVAALVLVSVSTLSPLAFAAPSSTNPDPQHVMGCIPRPQAILAGIYIAITQFFAF